MTGGCHRRYEDTQGEMGATDRRSSQHISSGQITNQANVSPLLSWNFCSNACRVSLVNVVEHASHQIVI